MFSKTGAELKGWQILVLIAMGAAAAFAVVIVLKNVLWKTNVISSNEGTFLQDSFMSPLSKDDANKVAAAHEQAVAKKAATAKA